MARVCNEGVFRVYVLPADCNKFAYLKDLHRWWRSIQGVVRMGRCAFYPPPLLLLMVVGSMRGVDFDVCSHCDLAGRPLQSQVPGRGAPVCSTPLRIYSCKSMYLSRHIVVAKERMVHGVCLIGSYFISPPGKSCWKVASVATQLWRCLQKRLPRAAL
jgi:hypothetical protein